MSDRTDGLVAERPRDGDAEGWFGLDAMQTLWPMLGYLEAAPARLRMEVRVAMSWRLWTVLKFTRFQGVNPIDPLGRKVFGCDVITHNDWPLERVEIVLSAEVKARDAA